MTIFAGIYSFCDNHSVDLSNLNIIKESIIHKSEDQVEIFSNSRLILVKFDFGLFQSPGFLNSKQDGVAAVAGEPFLNTSEDQGYSREHDFYEIIYNLNQDNFNILKNCNGTFSICSYKIDGNELRLASDKIGIRPLYYYNDEKFLYFSTNLKILENIDAIDKQINIDAFIESYVFGIPLGNNTKYKNIKLLQDGQIIKCSQGQFQIYSYFKWDQLKVLPRDLDEILKDCYTAFKDAIACRCASTDTVYSLLSGGLDSRCIVSILNFLKKNIVAFNSFLPGEQDQKFSEQYAKQIQIKNYVSIQRGFNSVTTEQLLAGTIKDAKLKLKHFNEPLSVFSGDGGSVGVGHVYMDETLLYKLQNESVDEAIEYFLKKEPSPKSSKNNLF